MTQFFNILNQLFQFTLILFIGYLIAYRKIIDKNFLSGLAKIIMKVLLPVLVFTNAINGTERRQIFDSYIILILSFLMYISLIIVFKIVTRIIDIPQKYNNVYRASMIFGNVGFIGIPLILSLYPKNGAVYIVLMSIVDQIFLWTYGLRLTELPENKRKFTLKSFFNPALVAVTLAIIIILLNIHIPNFFIEPLSTIGKTSTPLALIYLGGLIYYSDWKKILYRKELYVGVCIKMLLFPLLYYYILSILYDNTEIIKTIVLISAMPSMAVISIFAQSNKNEGEYVLGIVLVTTIMSMLTLNIISFIIF